MYHHPESYHPSQPQIPLPNSTAVLVLGIVSIVLCCAYGVIGLANGIVALALSGKAKKVYEENPSLYTLASYNNLKAGRTCAIVGTCLSSITLMFFIIYFSFIIAYIGIIFALLGVAAQGG
jgi:hypothetical protein